MSGRFGRMIGNLEFKIGSEEIIIKPKLGDNAKLIKIQSMDSNEEEKLLKFKTFIEDLMIRSYPEEDGDELKLLVEMYLKDFMREILVGFKWTTYDKFDNIEIESEKKLM